MRNRVLNFAGKVKGVAANAAGRLASILGYRGEDAETLARIERVVQQSDPVMILTVTPKGEVTGTVAPSADVLGVPAFLLYGDAFLDRIHLTDRVTYLSALDSVFATGGEQRLSLRIRLPQTNGDAPVSFDKFDLCISSKPHERTLLVTVRASDDRDMLLKRIAELEGDQSRLEIAKSRFLASTSHELRTPLNAIIGFADLMLMDLSGSFANDKQREYVGLIRASGQHLLSVVNTIIDMSKIETGHYAFAPEEFEVAAALDISLAMVAKLAADRGIVFHTGIDSDCERLEADQRAVQQILINLLSNAVKFTPSNGRVSVSVDRYANWMRFVVEDSGIGMDKAFVSRVGTPFLQADNDYTRQYEGTGLGLSVVMGLVNLHGGKFEIDSEPGRGTRVCVMLPAVRKPKSLTAKMPQKTTTDINQSGGVADEIRKSA